jgi:hypothetical protein
MEARPDAGGVAIAGQDKVHEEVLIAKRSRSDRQGRHDHQRRMA